MKPTIMTHTASFDDLIKKRFTKEELAEMKHQVVLEATYLNTFLKIIENSLNEYMKKNNATIDDIAEEVGWSKYKVKKFKNGEYNFTIPDVCSLLATLNKDPKEVFKKTY